MLADHVVCALKTALMFACIHIVFNDIVVIVVVAIVAFFAFFVVVFTLCSTLFSGGDDVGSVIRARRCCGKPASAAIQVVQ